MFYIIPHTESLLVIEKKTGEVYNRFTKQQLPKVKTDTGYVYKDIGLLSEYFPDGIHQAMLMMMARYDITVPLHKFKYLKVEHGDGDYFNTIPKNLYLSMPYGPIESEWHPGYFYIPDYKNILVSRSGSVITTHALPNNNIIKSTPTNGYTYYNDTSVIAIDGKSRSQGVHRLVALAFCHRPCDPAFLEGNHLDKNRGSNGSDNVELVSKAINGIHKSIMEVCSKINLVSEDSNGVQHKFTDLIAMGKWFGKDPIWLWKKLRAGGVMDEHTKFWLTKDRDVTDASMLYLKCSRYIDDHIRIRMLGSDIEHIVTTIKEARLLIGVTGGAIRDHLTRDPEKIISGDNGMFVIADSNDRMPTDEEALARGIGSGKKIVLCKTVDTGAIKEYVSAAEAIRQLELSKKIVTTSLRKDNKRIVDNYQFQYKPLDGSVPIW